MAPKSLSRGSSRQPSEEKPVDKEPSSEEVSSEDEGSESPSSSEEEKHKNDFSGETVQDEDEDLKSSKSKSVNQDFGSDSDSDLGTPSSYKLQPVSRVSKSSSKRTSDDDDSQRPSKKPKSVGSPPSTPTPATPGGCINRLWSDKDEISVLNGMIEFKNHTDIGAFYDFIKGKLQEKFSKDQLSSKIKRMKKRFSNAVQKSENGEDPVLLKPHEAKAFELSKKIWGGFVGVNGKNGKKDEDEVLNEEKVELEEKSVKENGNEEVGFVGSKYPFLIRSFESVMSTMPSLEMSKSGMSFALKRLSSTKAEELNEKWKALITEEVELKHKKLTLMQEQMNMAIDFVE